MIMMIMMMMMMMMMMAIVTVTVAGVLEVAVYMRTKLVQNPSSTNALVSTGYVKYLVDWCTRDLMRSFILLSSGLFAFSVNNRCTDSNIDNCHWSVRWSLVLSRAHSLATNRFIDF